MGIEIRLASLDDIKGIVDAHCSSVSKWFKRVGGKEVEAKYEDLTVIERFSLGGPWMSAETCAIHINNLLLNGQYPLIALLNGKIVGELEFYVGEEKGILGNCGFIDVLEVHKSFRRRGVGKALVNKAKEIAKEHECDTVAVWPDKEAIEFYRRCGLSEPAYSITHAEIDLNRVKTKVRERYTINKFPESHEPLKEMNFLTPRILTSFAAWLKSRLETVVERDRLLSVRGCVKELQSCYVIETLWNDKEAAKLYLWVHKFREVSSVLNVVFGMAKEVGIAKLQLLMNEDIYRDLIMKYPHKVLHHEVILMKELK